MMQRQLRDRLFPQAVVRREDAEQQMIFGVAVPSSVEIALSRLVEQPEDRRRLRYAREGPALLSAASVNLPAVGAPALEIAIGRPGVLVKRRAAHCFAVAGEDRNAIDGARR